MFDDNEKDLMDRQEFVDIICDILKTNDENFSSFAIDGKWGVGKTFILNMLENKLEDDYLIINFNAWENDFYDEPLIAILSCILEILNNKNMPKNLVEKVGETNTYLCKSINEEVLENVEPFKTIVKLAKKIIKKYKNPIMENTFDKNLNIKDIIRTLREKLSNLSSVKILFVIDELDRCLPEHALKVMERVHHLFQNLKGVTTLYLIDKTQLSGMIRQYYGETFSEKEYFEKLFSFSIKLDIGVINEKLKEIIKIYSDYFEIDPEFNMDLTIQDILNIMLPHIPARQKLSLLEQVHLVHKLTLKGSNKKFDFSVALFEIFFACLLKFYNDYYNNLMNNKTFVHPANYGFIVNATNNHQRLKKSLDEIFAQKVKFVEKNLYYPNSIIVSPETFYRSILLSHLNKLIGSECHIDINSKIQEKSLFIGKFNFDKNCNFIQAFVKILKRLE